VTRLEKYLDNTSIDYPNDVALLQNAIEEIRNLPPSLVQDMYQDFSDTYAATWLVVDETYIEEFRRWLCF